jgi:hypothetical protein
VTLTALSRKLTTLPGLLDPESMQPVRAEATINVAKAQRNPTRAACFIDDLPFPLIGRR